jgi:hypothetical protein
MIELEARRKIRFLNYSDRSKREKEDMEIHY